MTQEFAPLSVGFYTATTTLLAVFVLLGVSVRDKGTLRYSFFFAALLLLIGALEGGLWEILPPMPEAWHKPASVTVGMAAAIVSFEVARTTLAAEMYSVFRIILRGLSGIAAICAVVGWFTIAPAFLMLCNVMLAAMLIVQLPVGWTIRTPGARQSRMAILMSIYGVAFVVIACLIVLIRGAPDTEGAILLYRLPYAFFLILVMLTHALVLLEVRRQNDEALSERIVTAEREARLARELLAAEQRYTAAKQSAAKVQRQLSTVSHDFRQPLVAVRAMIDSMDQGASPLQRQRLGAALEHLNGLTDSLLETPGTEDHPADETDLALPLASVLSSLQTMYAPHAEAEDVELIFAQSELSALGPALPVMRILGNFLSNAIAHAGANIINVKIEDAGEKIRILITDDGIGLPPEELKASFRSGEKGDASSGHGLGLHIVEELSRTHGIEIIAQSTEGQGSTFGISLPRAG